MIVLGIDPGVATIGFGVIRAERQKNTLLQYGVITTPAGLPLSHRLLQIDRDMEELIPAGMSMQMVQLKSCIQLDWHTYLGINSRVGGYVPAAIDEQVTIHYGTTIGGASHE